eukprot:5409708-Amphidinium_carterae.2
MFGQFGRVGLDMHGTVLAMQGVSGFMTNDSFISRALAVRCGGGHDHVPPEGSTAGAQLPPRLVTEILRALRLSIKASECEEHPKIMTLETGPTVEEPSLLDRAPADEAEREYRDRNTGVELDPNLVAKARQEERGPAWLHGRTEGHGTFDSRGMPESRLVCQRTRGRTTIEADDIAATFSPTPPYEAFKLQLSTLVSTKIEMTRKKGGDGHDDLVMEFLDISRAHLLSPVCRAIFVSVDGFVYRLKKAMYGLRDAGAAFDAKVSEMM